MTGRKLCVAVMVAFSIVLPNWLVSVAPAQSPGSAPIRVFVDASDSARKLFRAELSLPVHAGPLTLCYPRWGIPTYSLPGVALDNIVGLTMSVHGHPLAWKRDPVDMFSFHVTIPGDVDTLDVEMEVVAPPQRSDLNAATAELLVLDWYTLLLYPAGASVDELAVEAKLRLPVGWRYASALNAEQDAPNVLKFSPTSMRTLTDSPVLAGRYVTSSAVKAASRKPVHVDIAAEDEQMTKLSPEWQDRFGRVVTEAGMLFGGYPYQQYRFLISLSDEVGNDGLEHRASSDIRIGLSSFENEQNRLAYGYLIPHEYIHSWNGTFRVPSGLVTRDFQQPQTTELLWVYEGLTRYLNWVLAARSGILTPEESRDYVALIAAQQDHRSGRKWRSLQDTAVSTSMLIEAPDEWQSERRGVDYYDESLLIWLEADTIIRRSTQGKRSLDDFCRLFFATREESHAIAPYTFEDVTAALGRVAAFDWTTFMRARLDSTGTEHAPLDGLVASGWSLVYGSAPGSVQSARDAVNHTIEERFSMGLLLREDGTVIDVVRDSAAWKAGLGPGMKVSRVDHTTWSPGALRQALPLHARDNAPMVLTVQNGSQSGDVEIRGNVGTAYPRLERNSGRDWMTEILKPQADAPTR